MEECVATNENVRDSVLFILKKSIAESHRLLVEVYDHHALSEKRVGDGLEVSSVVISTSPTKNVEDRQKIEDVECL